MSTRPAYSREAVAGFLAELERRHGVPAPGPRTGVVHLTGHRTIPRDLPPLTNADGTPAETLPTPHLTHPDERSAR